MQGSKRVRDSCNDYTATIRPTRNTVTAERKSSTPHAANMRGKGISGSIMQASGSRALAGMTDGKSESVTATRGHPQLHVQSYGLNSSREPSIPSSRSSDVVPEDTPTLPPSQFKNTIQQRRKLMAAESTILQRKARPVQPSPSSIAAAGSAAVVTDRRRSVPVKLRGSFHAGNYRLAGDQETKTDEAKRKTRNVGSHRKSTGSGGTGPRVATKVDLQLDPNCIPAGASRGQPQDGTRLLAASTTLRSRKLSLKAAENRAATTTESSVDSVTLDELLDVSGALDSPRSSKGPTRTTQRTHTSQLQGSAATMGFTRPLSNVSSIHKPPLDSNRSASSEGSKANGAQNEEDTACKPSQLDTLEQEFGEQTEDWGLDASVDVLVDSFMAQEEGVEAEGQDGFSVDAVMDELAQGVPGSRQAVKPAEEQQAQPPLQNTLRATKSKVSGWDMGIGTQSSADFEISLRNMEASASPGSRRSDDTLSEAAEAMLVPEQDGTVTIPQKPQPPPKGGSSGRGAPHRHRQLNVATKQANGTIRIAKSPQHMPEPVKSATAVPPPDRPKPTIVSITPMSREASASASKSPAVSTGARSVRASTATKSPLSRNSTLSASASPNGSPSEGAAGRLKKSAGDTLSHADSERIRSPHTEAANSDNRPISPRDQVRRYRASTGGLAARLEAVPLHRSVDQVPETQHRAHLKAIARLVSARFRLLEGRLARRRANMRNRTAAQALGQPRVVKMRTSSSSVITTSQATRLPQQSSSACSNRRHSMDEWPGMPVNLLLGRIQAPVTGNSTQPRLLSPAERARLERAERQREAEEELATNLLRKEELAQTSASYDTGQLVHEDCSVPFVPTFKPELCGLQEDAGGSEEEEEEEEGDEEGLLMDYADMQQL